MRQLAAWGCVACAVLALLLPLPKNDARLLSLAMDLAHVPLMAGVSIIAFRLFPGRPAPIMVLGLLAFQVLAEYLQPLLGRGFSRMDILLGASGVLLVLGLRQSGLRRGGLIVVSLFPVVFWGGGNLLDVYLAPKQFPLLADFSQPFSIQRWELNGLQGRWRGGEGLELKRNDPKEPYPGVTWNAMPHDWRGYNGLQLEGKDLSTPIMLRLDAVEGALFAERWNFGFPEKGETRTLWFDEDFLLDGRSLPVERSHIERVTIFFPDLPQDARLRIRAIRLLP